MANIKKIGILALLLLTISTSAFTQVRGRVLKNNGAPQPNTPVVHKNQRVVTDNKGWFVIDARIGDTLDIGETKYIIDSVPFTMYLQDNKGAVELQEVLVTDGRWKTLETVQFDKEEIASFRGSSNGELFNGIPDIQVNNIRNEAGALDIGIRGLQGEGRVPIIIDGGLQSTQTLRGYQGTSDRTYIEMDLVRQVRIDKGASSNPSVIGATGGVVEMKTISAKDVILSGNKFGVLFKGDISNNNKQPKIPEDERLAQYYVVQNKIKTTQFNGYNATLALAYKGKETDFLVAAGTRSRGNYFAGKNGADRYGYGSGDRRKEPVVDPGQEVVNTSYASKSVLAKLGWDIGANQRLEGSYRFHGQEAGEVLASYWYKNNNDADFKPFPEGVESIPQWALGTADLNFYSLNYNYNPNQTVDLQVSAYANNGKFKQRNGLLQQKGFKYGDQYLHEYKNYRKGITAYNKTSFAPVPLDIRYGAALEWEEMEPLDVRRDDIKRGSAREGKRLSYSAFVSGNLEWKKFLFQTEVKAHGTKVHDYTDQTKLKYGTNVDLVGKISYAAYNWLNLYGKASKIYRSPSLYESTKSTQTFSYNNDFPLKPESTTSYELGFHTHFGNLITDSDLLTIGAGGFYNNSKNFISATVLPTSGYLFSFINYDKYRLKGLDVSLGYESPRMFMDIAGVFYQEASVCSEAMGAYYKTDACNTQGFDWSVLPNRIPPRRSFSLKAGVYAFDKKLSLGGRVRYHSVKKNPKDWLKGTGASGIALEIPADHVIDVFGSYRFNEHISVNINVDNLTDRYQYDVGSVIGMPVPGRTAHIGLKANF